MSDPKQLAEDAKKKGNDALARKDVEAAISHYTEALKHEPSNHIHYSNRSAAFALKEDWQKALQDANKTVELQPKWGKGWGRKGAALFGLGDLVRAEEAYAEGLKHEPANDLLKKGLADVQAQKSVPTENPMGKIFSDPQLIPKILAHPELKAYVAQPDYMNMIQQVQKNPNLINGYLSDQRMVHTLASLLGIGGGGGGGGGGGPQGGGDEPMHDAPPPRDTAAEKKKAEEEAKRKAEEEAKKKAAADHAALPQNKREALAEKEKGTTAYKKRDFEAALSHYTRAMELDPDEMLFIMNRAAAHLEKGDYAACIQDGEKAVEVGRAHRADFKQIARAYARIGNAYAKQEKWDLAIQNYNKSLTEDRTAEVLDSLRKAEKEQKNKQDLEYRDPVNAEEANKLGNEAFKSHQYPDAVKHYSEALKRNPDDPKFYSNRAAAYTKLMAYAEALKDCEECLRRNPSFVKGYIRKGFVHFAMKDYNKALETYDKGLLLDPNNEELKNNIQQVLDRVNEGGDAEARERAMKNPEIQAILQDPVMMSILREMQENPSSMQKYLKDDKVRQNIEKLVAAGIVQTKSRPMPGGH